MGCRYRCLSHGDVYAETLQHTFISSLCLMEIDSSEGCLVLRNYQYLEYLDGRPVIWCIDLNMKETLGRNNLQKSKRRTQKLYTFFGGCKLP